MKKIYSILLMSIFGVGAAVATPTDGVKIGTINLPQILQQYKAVKVEQASLQKQFKPQGQQIVAARKTLLSDAKALRNLPVVKTERRQELAKVVLFDQQKLRGMQIKLQRELIAAQNTSLVKILKQVKLAVNQVANQYGYNFVMMQSSMAYYPNSTDITKQVIAQLNK